MERCVGLDSHARNCTLGVMSASGERPKSLVVETNGSALIEASPHRELAEWLGRQLDLVEPLRDEAERRLLTEAKRHPIIRKLATAPGMGSIRTTQVVAIVATPERFRTRRQFWSYSGLGIVTRSSADWVQDRNGKWARSSGGLIPDCSIRS